MRKLRNWTARRAGGRITINGVDAQTGEPVKVVGVDTIKPAEGNPIATDKDGNEVELGPNVDRTSTPLTIGQLLDRLHGIVAVDEARRDMRVTFGEDMHPICGGMAGKNPDNGLIELNLAPLKLDAVGGF